MTAKPKKTKKPKPKKPNTKRKAPASVASRARTAATTKAPADDLTFLEVTAARWKDFDRLFESPGAPKYCWCMAWRAQGPERKVADSKGRKAMMKRRVQGGVPVGLLGYRGGAPIAWCSIAPRPTYRELGGITREGEEPERVWSIACFYVRREHRGAGLVRRMIAEACRHAKARGATAVEAYPVDPDSPSYRYMGFKPVFDEADFEEVGRAGTRRYVMRRALGRVKRVR